MPKVKSNGIDIYYELLGPADADVLVLSNGILMGTASWAFQTPVFSKKHRLLLYDCRGMWQSDHPAGPYSMTQHADDLAALLDALQIESAHIGGISYGGEVSMAFALQYPLRTRSLIISSSVSHVDAPMRVIMNSWITATRAKDPDMLFEVTYPMNFSEGWIAKNGKLLEAAKARYRSLDFDAFLELLLSFSHLNLTPELPRITAPTLVMVGEQDILKSRRYAEIITSGIPGSEFVVIPNGGHAINWEQPGLFNTLILGFLSKHAAK